MGKSLLVPSLYFLLCMTGANLLVNGLFFKDGLPLYTGAGTIAAAQIIFFCLIRKLSLPPKRTLPAFIVMIALTALEVILMSRLMGSPSLAEAPGTFRAQVVSITPRRYGDTALLEYALPEGNRQVTIQAYVIPPLKVSAGDKLIIDAALQSLTGEGAGRFAKQLLRQGIKFTVSLHEKNCFIEEKAPPGIKTKIRGFADKIFKASFQEETAALLWGLYFNDRTRIDKHVLQRFKRAGVMHVLAASGLHVGIIAAIPLFVCGLLLFPKISEWLPAFCSF